jgi:hypothetical protein
MEHYDVLIATPGAMMEAQYVRSMVETLAECNKRGISYKWLNGYSSLVHHAREMTATGLESHMLNPEHKGPMADTCTYNKMIWIDSDIAWTPQDFFKIYDSEYDIVSGVYILADGQSTTLQDVNTMDVIKKNKVLKLQEPLKVFSTGFGFLAVKSGVFEKMERPWFKHFPQEIMKSDGTKIYDSMGEDLTWCLNAKNIGFDIYADPSVLVTHIKKYPLMWN